MMYLSQLLLSDQVLTSDVFQFSDECYIAVNGDGLETEQFLHHKLRVLHNILGFLLGPVSQA